MSSRMRISLPNILRRRGSGGSRSSMSENTTENNLQQQQENTEIDTEIEKRRLKSVNSASGMSQEDLRKTIRQLQGDDTIPAAEKAKRIQELMTFSWRKSQEISRETQPVTRKGSYGSMKVTKLNPALLTRTQSSGEVLDRRLSFHSRNVTEEKYHDALDEDDDTDGMVIDSPSADEATEDVYVVQTFQDKEETILGCEHYQRKCMVSAPCCNEFYTCRFCHDESCTHEIDRYKIDRARCMICGHVQGISKTCENCNTDFARYFCGACKFYDDKADKQIYHCEFCNICRIGEGLGIDYFHCHRCNACMSITLTEHKCVERSLESDCPVCHEFMFTSTIPVMFLPCGHCMHVSCYENYTLTNYTCPMCSKSLGNMEAYFKRIDEVLARETMPAEYRGLSNKIFCSDCEKRSIAPFHFLYHKCKGCGSYNTKVLEQLPAGTPSS